MKRLLIAATALIGVAGAQNASAQSSAQTTTTTIAVTASVAPTCSVIASPLAFLTVPVSTIVDSTALLNVTCTNGATYEVGLDFGANASGGGTQRNLKITGGATLLPYNLYQDAGHSIPWGNTIGPGLPNPITVLGSGNGAAQALTVYGEIPSQGSVTTGVYTDSVTVTVYY